MQPWPMTARLDRVMRGSVGGGWAAFLSAIRRSGCYRGAMNPMRHCLVWGNCVDWRVTCLVLHYLHILPSFVLGEEVRYVE